MQQEALLKCSEETRRLLVGLDKLQNKLLSKEKIEKEDLKNEE
jgi:hypothetical protein